MEVLLQLGFRGHKSRSVQSLIQPVQIQKSKTHFFEDRLLELAIGQPGQVLPLLAPVQGRHLFDRTPATHAAPPERTTATGEAASAR
jgi:hypothetical protein